MSPQRSDRAHLFFCFVSPRPNSALSFESRSAIFVSKARVLRESHRTGARRVSERFREKNVVRDQLFESVVDDEES